MKVLKYKNDGNTLIDKGMTLEKINDSVFFHKWEENVYGLRVYYDIVFLLGNTYFWVILFLKTFIMPIKTNFWYMMKHL
jgi:hypothetical protein